MGTEVGPIGNPSSNDMVRANLACQVDDGQAVRGNEHFAYPGPPDADPMAESELDAAMGERDFPVDGMDREGGPRRLVFVHRDPVVGAAFDGLTGWMAANIKTLGWVYDGWSCDVVPPGQGEAKG